MQSEIELQRTHTKEKEKQIDGLQRMVAALEQKIE